MLRRWFRRPAFEREAHDLYVILVRQARLPVFYRDLGVPDTPEGRFEIVVLHVFLLINRLNVEVERTRELSQQVFDVMFGDMDSALREMGVGDIGVGKRVKHMVQSFYGRVSVYEEGLAAEDNSLQAAFARNIFADTTPSSHVLEALETYVRLQHGALLGQKIDEFLRGHLKFEQVEPRV